MNKYLSVTERRIEQSTLLQLARCPKNNQRSWESGIIQHLPGIKDRHGGLKCWRLLPSFYIFHKGKFKEPELERAWSQFQEVVPLLWVFLGIVGFLEDNARTGEWGEISQ